MKIGLFLGNCLDRLKEIPGDKIDLVVTSPPYADSRASTYGGIPADEYVSWFTPISLEVMRALKPSGTFILNIKEKVENKERHTYVLELILSLRKKGWIWTEEFIWHKKNAFPGKWPNRLRDSWERLLQFNKSKKFSMYQEEVMIPIGEKMKLRLNKLRGKDFVGRKSATGSGFERNISKWSGRKFVYPANVLHLPVVGYNTGHSAAFPKSLPEWFIKLFTREKDWVLDPFAGSGTTILAAHELGRNSIGIESNEAYFGLMRDKFLKVDGATVVCR